MTKAKNTKKALLASALSLLVCISMLVGSTYAWFTDSVTVSGNTIQSGTLQVDLIDKDGNSLEGETLHFVDENGNVLSNILWEPGCTYTLQDVFVKNKGNLALKYNIVVNGLTGDAKLLEVIEWKVDFDGQEDVSLSSLNGRLAAGATSGALKITGHMKENAGNDYQNLTLAGISISIYATQDTVEADSFGNQYDMEAAYPVNSLAALQDAFSTGGKFVVTNDLDVTKKLTITKDVVLDLNGCELDASSLVKERPFYLAEGVNLTINANGATIILGEYGLINVPGDVKNATITLNGGTYAGNMVDGALVRLRSGNENIAITLNDVTFDDVNNKGYIVSTNGFKGTGTLDVNGGSYSAKYGFEVWGLTATLENAEIETQGTAVEAGSNSTVTIENCTLTTNGATVGNAPCAAVAASNMAATVNSGKVTISDSTITGTMGAVYHIYNTGGTIVANNTDYSAATATVEYKNDADQNGKIIVDGSTIAFSAQDIFDAFEEGGDITLNGDINLNDFGNLFNP